MNLTWKEQRLAAEAYRRDTIRMRVVVVLMFAAIILDGIWR